LSKYLVGIIAENRSDVVVIEACLRKIAPNRIRGTRTRLGLGCGPILPKCAAWAEQLHSSGCQALVVARDCDGGSAAELKQKLDQALSSSAIKRRIVVIPIQEIEAWLLSDVDAIRTAMNLKKRVKEVPDPEAVSDPKERIATIVWAASEKRRRYIHTKDNGPIAAHLRLERARRCKSFLPLEGLLLDRKK